MGIEKRTHVRFPARVRVAIQLDAEVVEGRTRDLSLGGMFIETGRTFAYGATFVVAVELPALAAPARIPCTVRWRVADGVGVSFGALRAAETWAINQLAVQVAS